MNIRSNMPIAWAAALAAMPASAADPGNGSRLYSLHCASCHGASGANVMPGAPNFVRGEKLMQPDPLLLASIKLGKRAMPAYAGVLRDREILDVVAFLRTLQR